MAMRPLPPRPLAIACALVVSGSALTACGGDSGPDTLLEAIEAGHVNVGSAFTNPGISVRDHDGNPKGLDVEVATYVINAIADANSWPHPTIEWRDTPPAQRESLLENGYVDMIASTYSITPERAEKVDFGGPYLLTHQALLMRQSDIGMVRPEGKLCIVSGTTAARTIHDQWPHATLSEYDSYGACLDALRSGHVEAVTTDAAILSGFAAQEPGMYTVIPITVNGAPMNKEHYGLGIRRKDKPGVDAINDALTNMYDDGSFDRFVTKNLSTDAVALHDVPGDLSFLPTKPAK